jgi:hypothetical protein
VVPTGAKGTPIQGQTKMSVSRSPVQFPADLRQVLESYRIRMATDTGQIPITHEVIRAAFIVAGAHYTDWLTEVIRIRESA